jgi:PAS domain S-box-containing protein
LTRPYAILHDGNPVPATRFSADINRLRATLRGHQGNDLIATVRREIERLPAAALVADNSQRYVAANAAAQLLTGYSETELAGLTVMDLTPMSVSGDGRGLWETFIGQGGQRGEYELLPKAGPRKRVRYWAFASVAPGLHISLLVPA